MSKWFRSSGFDQFGRKTIIVTENASNAKAYRSMANKFQMLLMKIIFFLAMVVFIPLGMLISMLS